MRAHGDTREAGIGKALIQLLKLTDTSTNQFKNRSQVIEKGEKRVKPLRKINARTKSFRVRKRCLRTGVVRKLSSRFHNIWCQLT